MLHHIQRRIAELEELKQQSLQNFNTLKGRIEEAKELLEAATIHSAQVAAGVASNVVMHIDDVAQVIHDVSEVVNVVENA